MTSNARTGGGNGDDLVVVRHGEIDIVRPKGDIDFHQIPAAREKLEGLIRSGRVRLILDLESCQYVASTTIGMLLRKCNQARAAGGDLKLAGATRGVQKTLQLLGVDAVFSTYATQLEAVAAF
jgi:anti-sigma B factor antagonist